MLAPALQTKYCTDSGETREKKREKGGLVRLRGRIKGYRQRPHGKAGLGKDMKEEREPQ